MIIRRIKAKDVLACDHKDHYPELTVENIDEIYIHQCSRCYIIHITASDDVVEMLTNKSQEHYAKTNTLQNKTGPDNN